MKKEIYNILFSLFSATLLFSCGAPKSQTDADIIVSIEPLKFVVEQITTNDFEVAVLIPQGASPETYDPTPRQIISLNTAEMVFVTGLIEFEQALTKRIDNKNIVDLSHGIELIEGACSHASHDHAHTHHHGVDPHIWTSPRELKTIAHNAYEAIMQHYPDSVKYTDNYSRLMQKLEELDNECLHAIESSNTKAFAIYHPALTYYARAYALEQIAIENDGKEPSAKHIAHIIDDSHDKGVTSLLYQSEYPRSVVEVVAKDMGIEPTEINPLSDNPIQFIKDVTSTLTGNNR